MNKNTAKEGCEEQVKKASIIKLGLDVHADSVSVARQVDGAVPHPVQKFTWEGFWRWITKQFKTGEKVYSCYEAGPFGYVLHRRLVAMGISNIVVRPQNWDELGKGVKTDKSDAAALVQRLDRYVGGNTKALAVVCVPTFEAELVRSQSRLREAMRKHRQEAEAQGRSMMLLDRISGAESIAFRVVSLNPSPASTSSSSSATGAHLEANSITSL